MKYTYSTLPLGSIIGIIGGGQLGRMLAMSVAQYGYHAHIFTPEENSPASEVAKFTTIAAYDDEAALKSFAANIAVITNEFENIPASTAQLLAQLKPLYPSPKLFAICQHRLHEKDFINANGGKTANYMQAKSLAELQIAASQIGFPCLVKTATFGYDGKGQAWLHDASDCETAWNELNHFELIIEELVPFVCEASIIIARNPQGEVTYFPIAENIHENGILRRSICPANISVAVSAAMQQMAKKIAEAGELIGIMAVECFILANDEVLINELAARPHNSGHFSMNGCNISQFEMLVRICAGLPMIEPKLLHPIVMHNLLGDEVLDLQQYFYNPNAFVHLYGKANAMQGRKMAHVNIIYPPKEK